MSSLPLFDLTECLANSDGWGPGPVKESAVLAPFEGLPYQPFNKCDRIGRIVDWLGVDRYKKSEMRDRYNERLYGSSATAGAQFDYIHDNEDANFQLRKLAQREQERREYDKYNVPNKMKRSIMKEQQKAYKVFLRRGGGTRGAQQRTARRYNERQPGKGRQPSVQVRPDWEVIKELDFQQLNKLSLPNVEAGKDIEGHCYGVLHYYDKLADRISVNKAVPLQRFNGTYCHITTTEDPIIHKLASSGVGNVFATDIILATLMTCTRSVNSWDIIARRIGNKLFFDKRSVTGVSPIGEVFIFNDALWVSETAMEPPSWDGPGVNNAKTLADEALLLNQNFRRQFLKRDSQHVFKFENEKVPFEEVESDIAYKYRTWDLGTSRDGVPIKLVARTEHDAVMQGSAGEVVKLTIKAFNEWDSSQSGGEDWRSKLEIQRGTVLATEVRNNNCKVAKWTLQAILAGSDFLKFGFDFVSRANVRNSTQHLIFGTQQYEPSKFASGLPSLNMQLCWVVRIYALPEGTLDSSEDEDGSVSSGDEAD
uniref:Eukaryotic translation initiation factor 3 subunit p66 n=1 Tax=Meloidogyne javanica TaxID=6303 RepID=A0A915M7L4_MELJA